MGELLALLGTIGVVTLAVMTLLFVTMIVVVGGAFVLVTALGPATRRARERAAALAKQTREAWATIAAERGLQKLPAKTIHLRGTTRHGAPMQVVQRKEYRSNGKNGGYYEHWIEVIVERVAPPGSISRAALLNFGIDRTVGAPAFDRAALVRVDDEHVARFGADFQHRFLACVSAQLKPSVGSGCVGLRRDGESITVDGLRSLVDAAEALAHSIRTGPIDDVLVSELGKAQAVGFRQRCLAQLTEVAPARARDEAQRLLACGEPQLELQAALLVGDLDVALSCLAAEAVPPVTRRLAIQDIAQRGSAAQVAQAIGEVPALPGPLQVVLLDHLASCPPRAGVGRGLLAVRGSLRPEAMPPWCRAVAVQEDSAAAEPDLIELLGADDGDTVAAAATALRAVGTAAAVPALKAASEGGGLFASARRVAACRQAVASIQARATGTAGDLSLVAPAPERGAVSEAAPPRPRRATESPERG